MLSITLICVGKLKEPYLEAAFAEYRKRLGGYCCFTLAEIPEQRLPDEPSEREIAAALGVIAPSAAVSVIALMTCPSTREPSLTST